MDERLFQIILLVISEIITLVALIYSDKKALKVILGVLVVILLVALTFLIGVEVGRQGESAEVSPIVTQVIVQVTSTAEPTVPSINTDVPNTPLPETLDPTSQSTNTPEPILVASPTPSISRAMLDELLGEGNWFCFPDRNDGVGSIKLPSNFLVQSPVRYIDTYRGRFQIGDIAQGNTGATVELLYNLQNVDCPVWQTNALLEWSIDRLGDQQPITTGSQIDALVGKGNWACLDGYTFGARIYFLNSTFIVEYPLTTVDISDGTKHGVGETLNLNGELTIWFDGSIPSEQCP